MAQCYGYFKCCCNCTWLDRLNLYTKDMIMLIIGFSPNTSRLLPRLFCRLPRHCAPILRITENKYIMLQFVRHGHIARISLSARQISLLQRYGWTFIQVKHCSFCKLPPHIQNIYSCVSLCKYLLNIRNPFIQTPRALYKKLKRLTAL